MNEFIDKKSTSKIEKEFLVLNILKILEDLSGFY